MRFTKMQGIGNDYVYIDCFKEHISDPAALAQVVSDRHFGIGSDGLILICPSKIADVRMRMFNADGSESQMCGNGIRCVAKYSYDHQLARSGGPFSVPGQATYPASLNIETGNGILTVGLDLDSSDKVQQVCVNMGQPILEPARIPVALAGESAVNIPVKFADTDFDMTCVSMGNPHAVFFTEDLAAVDLDRIGPVIEKHSLFPQRTNAHFVKIDGPREFSMRTWERGSGITLACGTGACACLVASVLTGSSQRKALAHLPGGDLELTWSQTDNCVYMTGPAVEVFWGEWPL
ncbi:MAG: diaminopimelate epimerase [Planctomycetes bacterium GWF2_50_10]|nr:MAG: diaminopimelate epimerase [Planctomycetes bacterium GWF2_50_10]